MGVRETGCEQGTGCIQSVSESGMGTGMHKNTAGAIKEVLACNKIEIIEKNEG